MKISYAEAMCDPTHYAPLAKAVEEVGFDAMVIPDSIAYPERSDSKYPYTPDGNREFLDGAPLGLFLYDPYARESKRGGAWTRKRKRTHSANESCRPASTIRSVPS